MKRWWLIVLQLVAVFFIGCKEDDGDKLSVTTSEVSAITEITAQSGGAIQFQGDKIIISQGVCWSTDPLPTVEDDATSDVLDDELFTSLITGLQPGTTYYIRAYATLNSGTVYGNEVSFTTAEFSNWKTLTTENSSMLDDVIVSITVDDADVAWIGTRNYLIRYDGTSFTNYKLSETTSNAIYEIVIDQLGNKWISAWSGLYKFDNSTFVKYSERVNDIYFVRKESTLYILKTFYDVERLEIGTGVSESCVIDPAAFRLGEGAGDRKFMCTFTSPFHTVVKVAGDNFCSSGTPVATVHMAEYTELTAGPDSALYFTTPIEGFGIVKPDLSLKMINPENSDLPSGYTISIAPDQQRKTVWIGCNDIRHIETYDPPDEGGLVEFSSATEVMNVYNTSNSGLPNNHVTVVAVQKDKILMGTPAGLTIFTP